MNRPFALVAGLLAIAPLAAGAQTGSGTQTFGKSADTDRNVPPAEQPEIAQGKRADTAMTADRLLRTLHRIDREEIEAGQLAQKKGGSAQVKDYGSMLVQDHTNAEQQVQTVADEMHVDLTNTKELTQADYQHVRMHRAQMERLQRLSGKAFDQTFAQLMSAAHQRAIDLVKSSDVQAKGNLKDLVGTLLPELQKHKDVADQILAGSRNTASAK
jgi:putative membrane protein